MTDKELLQKLDAVCDEGADSFGITGSPFPFLRDYIRRLQEENMMLRCALSQQAIYPLSSVALSVDALNSKECLREGTAHNSELSSGPINSVANTFSGVFKHIVSRFGDYDNGYSRYFTDFFEELDK